LLWADDDPRTSFVVIAEKELVRALLGAEDAPEGVDAAGVTDPTEADGALEEPVVLIALLARDALHFA
jgi:hypothetical protein